MWLRRLWLTDYRNHRSTTLELPPGLTLVTGANGEGKTNLLESVAWMATLRSFRGVPNDALIRNGAESAVVRAELDTASRPLLFEAQIVPGRVVAQVNRTRARRAADLLGRVRVTVFAPDDLVIVKGGPGERRRTVDDLLGVVSPLHGSTRTDYERVLRQRNSLLRQCGGRLDGEAEATLMVWDRRLVELGTRLADARADLVDRLAPLVAHWYHRLSPAGDRVDLAYDAPWRTGGLEAALAAARRDELRRGMTLVGPHRDDLRIDLDGMPARSHASQGQQRTIALALRLAGHDVLADADDPPVVLLDDVFSELDQDRATALVACLPRAQTLLTTATGTVPMGTEPDLRIDVAGGDVRPL